MLNIFDESNSLSRRKLLGIGSLGLGGLSLASVLGAKLGAASSEGKRNPLTGKSVIFLFQQGGPSQFETFDPKPDAPEGIRTLTDVIPTSIPGIHFGSSMEQLSKLAHKLVTVRSFRTNNSGHNIRPVVGPESLNANIGVHFARVAGAARPGTGIPTNAILYPATVNPGVPGPSARGDLTATGPHPSSFAPFVPGGKGNLQEDMKLSLPRERFLNGRKSLLTKLDQLKRQVDDDVNLRVTDDLHAQAYEVLLGGGVSKALDLSQEDSRVVAAYDTSHFHGGKRWNKVSRGRSGYYNAQAVSIGKLLLMARRLCEAGCGFVTIHAGYAGVWDMHADGNNLNMRDGMEAVGGSFDHAVAAFIRDLEARGMQDEIMLVCCGEMGRTPRINKNGGRDHWSRLSPLLLHGGGIGEGKTIGESDKHGGEPASSPYDSSHLVSSILRTVLDPGILRLDPSIPEEINRLISASPIDGLGLG
ncbi:MAG: hypothetical protein CMI26_09850 [Opitutae bacterium]|jgi:hypothetical protein|nr:hypothetical protein [Opitutae bacterium]